MVSWATVDHSYSEVAWKDGDGFVTAQSFVNMVEAGLCAYYAFTVWGAAGVGSLLEGKVLGSRAARAVLVDFVAGVVTATKTTLYCTYYFYFGGCTSLLNKSYTTL